MAENTSLDWVFINKGPVDVNRPTTGEIKFLNSTLSATTGEDAFDYVNTVELEYPRAGDGLAKITHEPIIITVNNHNFPPIRGNIFSGRSTPEYIEYYRVHFTQINGVLTEFDNFSPSDVRKSGFTFEFGVFVALPTYIGIELLRFRDDDALQNNNYQVVSDFMVEFRVKAPVIGTDVLLDTPVSTIKADLDSDAAVVVANQALIDSAIAVGDGGIHGGINLDSIEPLALGPSLIKDSDGKNISPKLSGIDVDSGQIDNLTFDSATGDKLTISDSATIANLDVDSAHIKTLSGNSLDFDSAKFDKIVLGPTEGITLGDSTESDGSGTLNNHTKILGTRITTPSLVSDKIEVDSANVGSELSIGRYKIEAGDSDDESVLLTNDYGGIHYYKNKSKYASVKFDESDDKWHFYPKIRVTDLDSDGLDKADADGITNDIRQLGAGGHGQLLSFNSILNSYEWDYIVRSGKFVNTDSDLAEALTVIPKPLSNTSARDQQRDLLHQTWKNINHGNIPNLVTNRPLKYPHDESMLGYVYYDTDSHTIKTLTTEHIPNSITGFVSDKSYPEYEATVKFTGDTGNKSMGFIIAYVNEGELSSKNGIDVFAKQSTLTVFRTPNPAGYDGSDTPISNDTNFYTSYALVYNAFQPDQLILDNDGTSELGGTTHSTWDTAGVTAVKIKKDLNYLRLTLSDFGDSIPDVDKILEFNLDDNFDGLLSKFSGQVSYGVTTNGVKGGRFDIQFDNGAILNINTDDQIIDLKNDQVYIYVDSDASTAHNWPLGYKLVDSDDQGNPIDYFKEEFSLGRIYHNPESKPPRTFYKDPFVSFQLASIFENIVEDTTPQLGGNLDLNGFDINNVTGPIVIDPAPVNGVGGLVKIKGDLEVQGTTTTVNSTELTIADKNIEIAKGAANAAAADGGGITIDGADATILYNADSDVFALNKVFANPNSGAQNLISSYNTNQLSEGTNLYFTTPRARASVSGSDAGGDGSFSYNSSTGVITYTGPSPSETRAHFSGSDAGGDGSFSYNNATGVMTYTGPSASETRAHFSGSDAGGDGSFSYNSSTGVMTYTGPSASETQAHFSAANTGAADYAQLAYSSGVYTLNVDSLVSGEIPSLDAGKITTGGFDNDRITQGSITQHEGSIAVAGSQLTGTIPVERMADSAVLLDNTGVIPSASVSVSSVSQHATAITTAQDAANAFPNLSITQLAGSSNGNLLYAKNTGTVSVSFPKNYGRIRVVQGDGTNLDLNATISGAALNDRFELRAGTGIELDAPAAAGWEGDYIEIAAVGGAAGLASSTITITGTPAAGTTLVADGSGGFANSAISYANLSSVPSTFPPTLGTSSTTALAGDTALLALGTSGSTALAGNTALLALGTSSTTALAGDTALLALGTSSTTALAGDTALLALGTSGTTALAGNTALFDGVFSSLSSKPTTLAGYGITDALAGNTALLALGTSGTTALAGNTALLALGTSGTTALAGNTALLALGTSSTTALAGDTALFNGAFSSLSSKPTTLAGYGITDGGGDVTASSTDTFTNKSGSNSQWTNDEGFTTLALGTSGTTALAGDTALLALGTSSSTALAGDTALLALGTTSSTALAGNTALLALGTTSSTALAGNTTIPSAYSLPTASSSTLGGIKVGSGLSISSGTLSASSGTTINTNANNRVITGSGTANTLNGESGMTFNGSTLAISGAITATGNVTAAFSSDLRLKENLEKIENSLDKVGKINGYTFNWNDKSDQNTEVRDVGVIAQEVEEILPEVVIDRVDGYKAVYYEKLVPLLIESIKELKIRVEELENK